METVTGKLVDFIMKMDFAALPHEVIHECKRILLDSLGCALLSRTVDKGRISIELARRLGGPPESTVIGSRDKVSAAGAAFANGELINAMDMDVAVYPGGHVSPLVIPACLALAESKRASGKELLLALALAHEIAQRIGGCLGGMKRYNKQEAQIEVVDVYGYSFSIFGGAAGAGRISKLSREQMLNAVGMAGYFSAPPTVMKWRNTDHCAMTKYVSAGWVSEGVVTAVLLAELGYLGDHTVLDGDYSYWRFAGSDRWRPENLFKKLGEEWQMLGASYKLYPCCGTLLGSVDAFVEIIAENNLSPELIDEVRVYGDPFDEKPLWTNTELWSQMDTEFSVPYIFSLLAYDIPGIEWQEKKTMQNPRVLEFMKKVSLHPHPEFDRLMLEDRRNNMSAVDVIAKGQTFRKEKAWFKGGAFSTESRLTDEELKTKFLNNVSRVLTPETADKAVKAIFNLEKENDISAFLPLFTEKN